MSAQPIPAVSSRPERHADLMLLAVALVWGSSYGVTKLALAWYRCSASGRPLQSDLALLLPHLWRLDRATRIATLHAGLPLGLVLWMIFSAKLTAWRSPVRPMRPS